MPLGTPRQTLGPWPVIHCAAGRRILGESLEKENAVIVIRFRVKCQPAKSEELAQAFQKVLAPSRAVVGVISFDIGRDVDDANAFIATEVFEDAAARERQESLPEVANVMTLLPTALAAPPEATLFEVSSSSPAM
ncbi:MAG: antibiotic biosynthesis monooxygenase [Actinobacteria bacterium]|nr:MAG: antibiotic biosynthesis monooxygenase [Actinomycetota bacterium]